MLTTVVDGYYKVISRMSNQKGYIYFRGNILSLKLSPNMPILINLLDIRAFPRCGWGGKTTTVTTVVQCVDGFLRGVLNLTPRVKFRW